MAGLNARLAPVQVNYLGYFATSGLASMDYWLGDSLLFPVGHTEWATESLFRQPRPFLAWTPQSPLPEAGVSVSKAPSGPIRFGSFNHNRKLSDATDNGARYGITIDDNDEVEVDAVRPVDDVLSLLYQGRSWEAGLVEIEDGYEVEVVGLRHEFEVMDPRKKALRMAEGVGDTTLKTQMPGRVVRILVAEGETVEEGQPVIVVEAMKMENELKSPMSGTVQRLCVEEGEQVQARSSLIEFE